MLRVALVIFIVLMVQQTVMVALRIGGAHPDLLWLLPITAALLDGPETGAIVGFWAGLAFDLVLPTPFGLSALVGCVLGYAVGSLTTAADPRPTWLKPVAAVAGSVGADMLFAVLGAILGQGQMVQVDFLALFLVVGDLERGAGAPGQPADAVGPGRGEPPPLTGLRPGRQQGLVKRTLRHPIRGDRLHPKPSTRPAKHALLAGQRPRAAHAAPQERQRRLHRRLARGRGGTAESPPAHRRHRRPAPLRRPRPPAVDAAGGRGEELRRRRDAQPGARGQRGRAPGRDRRSRRHGPGVQHAAGGDPALAGRGDAEPDHRGHGGGARRPDAEAGAGVHQQQPVQPLRAGARRDRRVAGHRAVPPDAPVGVPRRQRADGRPAHLPPGRDDGHAYPRLRRRHHAAATWPPTPTTATPRAARSASRGSRPSTSPT